MEGVRGIFGASQIEGSNSPVSEEGQRMHQHQHQFNNAAGHMRKDETVFADGVVHTVGQVIALVVADTEAQVGCPAWDLLLPRSLLRSLVQLHGFAMAWART